MPNLLSTSEEWLHYYTPGSSDEDEIEEEWETGVDLWVCSQDEHDQWGQQSGPLIDWDLENSTGMFTRSNLVEKHANYYRACSKRATFQDYNDRYSHNL